MYAFISNEYRTVVQTQRQLDLLASIYTYPQFKKVGSKEEALKFFSQCDREFIATGMSKFGKTDDIGYIRIQYFLDGKNVYANIGTKYFGFIKLSDLPNNVKQDSSYDLLKLKICNVNLNNLLIADHCLAISSIIKLFDSCINVELVIPDISIFLACTRYKGRNYAIRRAQNLLSERMGKVFYTIK